MKAAVTASQNKSLPFMICGGQPQQVAGNQWEEGNQKWKSMAYGRYGATRDLKARGRSNLAPSMSLNPVQSSSIYVMVAVREASWPCT